MENTRDKTGIAVNCPRQLSKSAAGSRLFLENPEVLPKKM